MIKNAVYLTSAASAAQILKGETPEIAVVGRSNVGKSSFINLITANNKLARTSKEPGRTRLINYFSVNGGEFNFVDLPGYGFARVSDAEKKKWAELMEAYFRTSASLRNVFLLLDIRRDVSGDDVTMINYLYHFNIPFTVICTKSDKLSRSAAMDRRRKIAQAVKLGADNVLVSSALTKQGKADILQRIDEILSFGGYVRADEEDGGGEV